MIDDHQPREINTIQISVMVNISRDIKYSNEINPVTIMH